MSLYVLGMIPFVFLILGIVVCLIVLRGVADQQMRRVRCEQRLPGVAGDCPSRNDRKTVLFDQCRRAG